MDSKQLIDAQFDRAVEMVQSLPKMGAIQTGYEEKLAMYSLYKQATVGNVKSPRPGMWDMLGRAKWDAWAKHKDLDPHEAKWLYIDELLRVLRKHEDKPAAQEMVEELESFGGDAGRMVMSGTSTGRSRWSQSQSSGSSTSSSPAVPGAIPQPSTSTRREQVADTTTSEEEDSDDDEANERVGNLSGIPHPSQSQLSRPMSSMSNQRYRTPMGGSLAMSPPPPHPHMGMHSSAMSGSSAYAQQPLIPASQPMPTYETPSAFTGPSPPAPQADPNRVYGLPYPANMYAGHPSYRVVQPIPSQTPSAGKQHIGSPALPHGALSPIERAVAGVQAHLAALQERLETLETNTLGAINPSSTPYHSHSSLLSRRSSGSPAGRLPPPPPSWIWDWDPSDFNWEHMGMWSLVLSPLARTTGFLVKVLAFLLHRDRESRMSPALVVLRRLLLDLSFVLCAMMMVNKLWRKTGIRRREVLKALKGLWRAVIGNSVGVVEKVLVERGV